jgi:hypothetical protein
MVNVRTGLPVEVSPLLAGDRQENIQPFLQGRFMDMYERLADTLSDIPGILGFEVRPLPCFLVIAC